VGIGFESVANLVEIACRVDPMNMAGALEVVLSVPKTK
jgi:hypothetical protein